MSAGQPPTDTVVVTVGTDHHPFDRLLAWAAAWPGPARLVVQSGTSTPPPGLDARPFLPASELDDAVRAAVAVVCHGGPASVLQARHAGRLPIVVPRRADLGEHVDDHQLRFAAWMARHGRIHLAATAAELHAALDRAVADPDAFAVADERGRREEVSALFGDLVDTVVAGARAGDRRPRRRSGSAQ